VEGRGGVLLGFVVGATDIRYFEEFYRAITLRDGGAVALWRRDGVLLARFPRDEATIGKKLSSPSPLYLRVEQGGGTFRSPGFVDGIERIVSVHPLRDFPLAVTVSFSEQAIFADWRQQSLFIGLGTLCTIVGFALLLRALLVHSRSLERSEATLRESEARCRDFAAVSGNPFFDEAGRFLGYRGTARDITEKVRAERVLHEAKAGAEAANLAKSQFLANMSHELRTPLNAILGFSEVLENGIAGPLQSRQKEYIGLIRQSGEHLLHVINEILDLARIDAGKLDLQDEVIDPRRLVDSCVALVMDRARAGLLRLSVEVDGDVPRVMADRTRVTEILLNLLTNAIKFTELGGSVTVTLRQIEDGGIAFAVRDTGTGMTPSEVEIALELFGQVDSGLARRHEGTGLGLPLARKLTELHGGSLTITSEKGRGTTVTVTLPAARVVSLATSPAGSVSAANTTADPHPAAA
jgi:signal transduction histidine kinase